MLELIFAVLIVLSGSALCSSAETALFSASRLKVRQLAQLNYPSAIALLAICEKMNRPIATIVILNNIFNIVGSMVIGSIATSVLGSAGLGVFSGLLTFLIIIFGEILPKTVGERYADRLALWVALPVTGLTFLFTPLVWMVEKVTTPFTSGKKRPTTNESEIKLLANIGYQEGLIEDDEAQMIHRVFRLNDLKAVDLMTPRSLVTYLHSNLNLGESIKEIIGSQHTRIIVVENSIDQVVGFALKDELLTAMVEGKKEQQITTLTRSVRFVPEMIRSDKLLKLFLETREHLVVVVDEYGNVAGIVTLEDVLEILTGEIVDETDRVIDLQDIARKKRERLLRY